MTILSKLKDRILGPKIYVVVIDEDGQAYALHPGRVIKSDKIASKPSRYSRARKLARAINKELDKKNADRI